MIAIHIFLSMLPSQYNDTSQYIGNTIKNGTTQERRPVNTHKVHTHCHSYKIYTSILTVLQTSYVEKYLDHYSLVKKATAYKRTVDSPTMKYTYIYIYIYFRNEFS